MASYFERQPPVGARIEIPVHYDLWMRGARTGTVTGYRQGKPGYSDYVTVRMDNSRVRTRVKVWRPDWSYCKDLSAN